MSLWCIAWEDEQIVGMVLNRIDAVENADSGRSRGMVESVCVRRPWRGQGIAGGSLSASLERHRALGMTEAILMVDVDDPTGALRLYQSMGFEVLKRATTYRKVAEISR